MEFFSSPSFDLERAVVRFFYSKLRLKTKLGKKELDNRVSALLYLLAETQGQCPKNSSIGSLLCWLSSAGFCSSGSLEPGVPGVERVAV
jgi:hypothetical protein